MKIAFVEIGNFRKLKATRIEFEDQKTVFVGANNSGKTSATVALRYFLVRRGSITLNDVTLSNWSAIKRLGEQVWESYQKKHVLSEQIKETLTSFMPYLDLWLKVNSEEIHYVSHLLPTLDWRDGLLGVRLRYEPKNFESLVNDYCSSREAATSTTIAAAQAAGHIPENSNFKVKLWPESFLDFLGRRLAAHFNIAVYCLNPQNVLAPDRETGFARPQTLPPGQVPLEGDPLKGLIRVDEISAQRGFGDAGTIESAKDDQRGAQGDAKLLSKQLQSYYSKHLDPSEMPDPSDVDALNAIHLAKEQFDEKLREAFSAPLKEVESLNYPGISNPTITISTHIRPVDGLDHDSAVQYEVVQHGGPEAGLPLRLTEQYNGLGYQNLISMAFRLMGFRDEWMQVGKLARKNMSTGVLAYNPPPIHLVIIEEPEAHLHCQVQQVFIKKAYSILRDHPVLKENSSFTTQMVVSTHASHIAHECDFAWLRYFRRRQPSSPGEVPTSTVVNLTEVFGRETNTSRFVKRYLRVAHSDLFFADAAILIEGPAERILVPHFMRKNEFNRLNECYVTLLEVGGSHAHRFRTLVEHLNLPALIIADIDPARNVRYWPGARAQREIGLITRSTVLRKWHPCLNTLDQLYGTSSDGKVKIYNENFSVRVAYQCPVRVQLNGVDIGEALPNTFEDALVYENADVLRLARDNGFSVQSKLMSNVISALENADTAEDIGVALHAALQNGDKAAFAMDLLFMPEQTSIAVPSYINEGLLWLQDILARKQQPILVPDNVTPEETQDQGGMQ